MTQEHDRIDSQPATPADHVRRYAAVVGKRFELVRVLPGGRAIEIVDDGETHFVLKWDSDARSKRRRRDAIAVAGRLGAEARWPVPDFDLVEADEWLYVKQNLLAGVEPTRLTQHLWKQVVELVDSTAGLGSSSAAVSDWPLRLVDTLVANPSDPTIYCSHDPLRQHGTAGRRLISLIEAVGATGADLSGGDDLMHWDLHPGNVLVLDNKISAVIDLDNAGPGPRGFDLVTFALSSQILPSDAGAAREVAGEARARVSDELWAASVAHLVLRFSNWAMRTGHSDEAEHWIAEGTRLLTA